MSWAPKMEVGENLSTLSWGVSNLAEGDKWGQKLFDFIVSVFPKAVDALEKVSVIGVW